MAAATCRECGRHITWAKDKNGQNIPLQKIEAYDVFWDRVNDGGPFDREYQAFAIASKKDTYVAHFKICPGGLKK